MKRITSVFLVALLVAGLWVSSVDARATSNYAPDCRQCHSFSNQPPTADAGTDKTAASGGTVTLSGSGSDPQGEPITYAWSYVRGATDPSVNLSNAGTRTATFSAPNVTAATRLTFRLTVTDRLSQSATDTVYVNVSPATGNQVPVANAGQNLTVTSGGRVTFSGSGSDTDGSIASYSWTPPSGITLTGISTATPSFTAPQVTQTATLTFSLVVTDNAGARSAADTVDVRVSPAGGSSGLPPVADAGLDLMVLPGTLINLDGFYSTDPDDGIVSYTWEQTGGPDVGLSDPSVMDPIFQAPSSPAILTFTLVVTDAGGNSDNDSVTVEVLSSSGGTVPPTTPTNQSPVANAGRDLTVRSDSTVRLAGSQSTDADDGIASYQWRQISGTSVRLSGATTANASFRAPSVGSRGATLTFELTVEDEAGQNSSDTVTVKVSQTGGGDDDEEDDEEDDD